MSDADQAAAAIEALRTPGAYLERAGAEDYLRRQESLAQLPSTEQLLARADGPYLQRH